jgi:hypothetical protein
VVLGRKRMEENGREWKRMKENGREWKRMEEVNAHQKNGL